MEYSTELKARVLEKIISHLEGVIVHEPRRREQLRARIALKNIRACLENDGKCSWEVRDA